MVHFVRLMRYSAVHVEHFVHLVVNICSTTDFAVVAGTAVGAVAPVVVNAIAAVAEFVVETLNRSLENMYSDSTEEHSAALMPSCW